MPKTSARLLALLSLLQARRDWPGDLLAERLAVSSRTVRRDVDRLRELGYPVRTIKGPAGGYRLDAGTRLPPLLFDDAQAVAVAVALQVAAASGVEIEADAVRALTTVRQVMPDRLRHRVDALRVTAVGRPVARPEPPVDSGVLVAVGAAVHAHDVLRFDYASDSGPPRRVEPHHLVAWSGRWYLVAWDLDRDDWRTFRVDRMRPWTPAGPRFTPRALPAPDVATFVAGRFRGSSGSAGWPCVGEVLVDRPVAEVASYVRDGLVEERGPGRCSVVLGSWSWTALAAAFGRFDADLEVVGPAELREAFAVQARRYRQAAEVPRECT